MYQKLTKKLPQRKNCHSRLSKNYNNYKKRYQVIQLMSPEKLLTKKESPEHRNNLVPYHLENTLSEK